MNAHEIDYVIYGEEMQYVEIELDPQEAVVAEAGSFMMMDSDIKMDTIFGDGSNQDTGVLGKLFSAGKRLLTGESLFMTAFLNIGYGKKQVSFASPYPGKIIPIDLSEFQGKFICQKDAFLCAAKGVSVGIEFSKRLGRGLFGGEGFIMQKLEGDGMAFVHAGGTTAKKVLGPGETLKVDTGCIIGFTKDVDYDIEFIGGIKNTIFGGEGLFYATLRGPGTAYIQSLPFSRLAGRVLASIPRGGKDRGEGSILGGLGDLLDGDNRFQCNQEPLIFTFYHLNPLMNFNSLFQFLTELNQNNSKEWMDGNRKWYKEVRDDYIAWLDELDLALGAVDNEYYSTPGKIGINRINNNLMFHPNKPIYKDHFGAGLDKAPNTADFYIEIGLGQSMLAGGFWRPDPKTLRSIRESIDYDGEEFKKILNKKSFKDTFGELVLDGTLKNAPKGFSKDHPHVELLRHKTFAVMHPLAHKEILKDDFKEKILSVYMEMLPFRRYLNKAVTV